MKTGKIIEKFWEEEGKKGIHGVIAGSNIEVSTIASINLLLRHFNFDDKKILDAGCGVGRLIPTFSMYHNPKEVVGIDWSSSMIEEAEKNNSTATFQKAPLWDIPIEDEYFDFTVAFTACFSPYVVSPLRESFRADTQEGKKHECPYTLVSHNNSP